MRIAHLSDIHFGKIEIPEIVEQLVSEINQLKPDLVVVSGDLTQRARRIQYEAAARMLHQFEPPVLVVPGNHDVHAWWRPRKRIIHPLERYLHYVSSDLNPRFRTDGLAVLGINSAHGRTIMGGRIEASQRAAMREFFGPMDSSVFKVLVVHHHLVRIQALGPHDVAKKARQTLRTAADTGVDLILCGHLHISHIHPVELEPRDHRLVVASAGTATSSRGRLYHRYTNFYNVIEIGEQAFTIAERRYNGLQRTFRTEKTTLFERVSATVEDETP